MNNILSGLIKPGLPNASRGTFPELENLSAFLSACRKVGVAEHSLFDPKDLHEKRGMQAVVRCLHVLGAAVQSTVPEFNGPFLGKESMSTSMFDVDSYACFLLFFLWSHHCNSRFASACDRSSPMSSLLETVVADRRVGAQHGKGVYMHVCGSRMNLLFRSYSLGLAVRYIK